MSRTLPPKLRLSGLLIASLAFSQAAVGDGLSFKKDVAPILVKSCLGCHNDRKAANGLNMATFAGLRKGGKASGAEILVPGDPDTSELVASIRPDASPRMPYKLPPLPPEAIAKVERWVKEGAKFDGPSEAETPLVSLVDPLADLPKIGLKAQVSAPVTSVAFSPDGKAVAAVVGRDVLLIDPATGKTLATLAGHPGPLTGVEFTPDGGTLVACGGRAGQFGSVLIWDLKTKSKRFDLRGHADSILSADLSRDGKTLATASYDRLVKLWDVAAGKEIRTLKEHTDAVHAVAFAPDGKTLASAGADRTVKLWRVSDGFRLVSLSDATAEVYALAFASDGKTLYAGGVDRSIRAWKVDGETAGSGRSTFAHDAPIVRLVVSPDGSRLVSAGEDRTLRLWDASRLQPLATWPGQGDWPLAFAFNADGSKGVVGRYDGSIALIDAKTGATLSALREASKAVAKATAAKPELVRGASLNPVAPRGAIRGQTVRVTLSGQGVGQSHAVLLPGTGLNASIVPPAKPDPNRLDVDLAIAPDAPVGVHLIGVQTPLGVPAFQLFTVGEYRELADAEPAGAKADATPLTYTGTIDRPGDVDLLTFPVKAGQPLLIRTRAREVGSPLTADLSITDDAGRPVASARTSADRPDPSLSIQPTKDGIWTLRVADADFAGSSGHFYRIDIAPTSEVRSTFPLGLERGKRGAFDLAGLNLGASRRVELASPPDAVAGTLLYPPVASPVPHPVVVAEGPQSVEAEGNDAPAKAGPLPYPGGVSGRIGKEGDVDLYRIEGKKGRRVILEVFGRRLNSPIDPAIEVVDAAGKPVPRALLRPVEKTTVAFRDHNSTGRSIRLTVWDHLAIGDHLLVGRELMRLAELPRNPDDDAVFWGLGSTRLNQGERLGLLETTPEQHPIGQPMYKVEIHPPGTKLPPGGLAPVTLPYRNDDGGPGFGKDARLTFDPPADGTYFVRVEDVRGLGGPEFGYHLVHRPLRPDFKVALATENPNIPRGGSAIVVANLTRIDGFEGAVDVEVEGLPPGITATSARIEPGAYTADFLLSADESAPAFSPPTWKIKAKSVEASPGTPPLVHNLDLGGPSGGWITVTPRADLSIKAHPVPVVIHPGERVELTFSVERSPAFKGRVPIDVRNLPAGVRVLNIGLNGVLVTEAESSRSIFLLAEPWAVPTERPFYAVGKVEATGASASSAPIPLIVLPADTAKPVKAAAR